MKRVGLEVLRCRGTEAVELQVFDRRELQHVSNARIAYRPRTHVTSNRLWIFSFSVGTLFIYIYLVVIRTPALPSGRIIPA